MVGVITAPSPTVKVSATPRPLSPDSIEPLSRVRWCTVPGAHALARAGAVLVGVGNGMSALKSPSVSASIAYQTLKLSADSPVAGLVTAPAAGSVLRTSLSAACDPSLTPMVEPLSGSLPPVQPVPSMWIVPFWATTSATVAVAPPEVPVSAWAEPAMVLRPPTPRTAAVAIPTTTSGS